MAQKLRFTKDFDYSPRPNVDIAYKKGEEYLVPESHLDAIREAGVTEDVVEAKSEPQKAEKPDAKRR